MISRRELFGVFRRANAQEAKPKEGFSLTDFYARREGAPAPLPTFRVRDGGIPTETTRVGVTVEDPSREFQLRFVRVKPEACLAYHSFCTVCSERCPVDGAIVIELGRPRIVETHCTGCGICVQVCPAPLEALELVAQEPVA
ncbi:MAG: 4Fe-4S dicluster domain-containing protein [Polyangiales bacterium]